MSIRDWLHCVCTYEDKKRDILLGTNPNQSKFHQIVRELADGRKKIYEPPNRDQGYRQCPGRDVLSPLHAPNHGAEGGGSDAGADQGLDPDNEGHGGRRSRVHEPPGRIQVSEETKAEPQGSGGAESSNQGLATKDEEVADLRGRGREPKLSNFKRVAPRPRYTSGVKKPNKK